MQELKAIQKGWWYSKNIGVVWGYLEILRGLIVYIICRYYFYNTTIFFDKFTYLKKYSRPECMEVWVLAAPGKK
jgi:hypothetical protein